MEAIKRTAFLEAVLFIARIIFPLFSFLNPSCMFHPQSPENPNDFVQGRRRMLQNL